MSKDDFIELLGALAEEENRNYARYMELNPQDEQRTHDHNVICSVHLRILAELRNRKF